jgi:hypothetical protein
MSAELVELFPRLQELKRTEKLFVIQFLVSELVQEEGDLIQPNLAYPLWSPYDAFGAASTMLNALAETPDTTYAE